MSFLVLFLVGVWPLVEAQQTTTTEVANQEASPSVEESGDESQPDDVITGIADQLRQMRGDGSFDPEVRAAPELADPKGSSIKWLNLLFALLFTVALIYVTLWFLRKFFFRPSKSSSRHVKILTKTFLSPKSSVYLVQAPGKIIIVGESQSGLTALGELEPEYAEAIITSLGGETSDQSGRPAFQQELDRFSGHLRSGDEQNQLHGALAKLKSKSSGTTER